MVDWDAGPEFDVEIERLIFGRQAYVGTSMGHPIAMYRGQIGDGAMVPPYSSGVAAAWRIVEQMYRRDYEFTMTRAQRQPYEAQFTRQSNIPIVSRGLAETAPLAICRAALAAMEE